MSRLHQVIDAAHDGSLWALRGEHAGNVFGDDEARRENCRIGLNLARDAVCFDIGPVEKLIGLPLEPELFRLPYPTCWFEFQTVGGSVIGTLAAERSEKQIFFCFGRLAGHRPWVFVGTCIKTSGTARLVEGWEGEAKETALGEGRVYCDPRDHKQLKEAIQTIGTFLTALNCCNVARKMHAPSAALNRARARKGKLPIFSYWTLELKLPASTDSDVHLGGTHASPRLHLRRGHVRQSKTSGRYWWVQPHMVGNKSLGMVHKDYALAEAA